MERNEMVLLMRCEEQVNVWAKNEKIDTCISYQQNLLETWKLFQLKTNFYVK